MTSKEVFEMINENKNTAWENLIAAAKAYLEFESDIDYVFYKLEEAIYTGEVD
jgi:hypothetical protein